MKIFTTISLFILSLSSFAQDYPPGHIFEKKCQQQRHVKICAFNQGNGHPQIRIEYLKQMDSQSVWVRLNGREGYFPLSDNSVLLNEFRDVHRCIVRRGNQKLPSNSYPECPESFVRGLPRRPSGLIWFFFAPDKEESEIFFYTRNNYGQPNVWEIETAFVDRFGNWDSHNGKNYRFTFRP